MLDNSAVGPVLVHFRSSQRNPAADLETQLEALVRQHAGAFLLVNVDSDRQPDLIRQHSVTRLPTLKLFIGGQVSETLAGTPGATELQAILARHVAAASNRVIDEALQEFNEGRTEQAYQRLGQGALDDPGNYKLPLTIATLMGRQGRHEEALRLLMSMPAVIRRKPACARQIVEQEFAWIAQPVKQADELERFVIHNPDQLPAAAMLAAWYVTRGRLAKALEYFAHIHHSDPGFENGLGQRSIRKLLTLLPDGDPLIEKYRD